MRGAARAAGVVAAVRGLRALPLHAGRDQERDPDPVRDRLPARLRGGRRRPPSTTCGSSACSRPTRRSSCAATARFLQAAGERHEAAERRLELGPTAPWRSSATAESVAAVRARGRSVAHGAHAAARRRRSPTRGSGGCASASTTRPRSEPGLERSGGRCVASLLSTPRRDRGPARGASSRRSSARATAGAAVASLRQRQHLPGARLAGRRRVLAAAIVLPDHPRIAPESLGNLFDNTEIEEALLLHVQALCDAERARDRRAGPGGARDDRAGGGGRPRRAALPARADEAERRAAAAIPAPSREPGHPNPGEAELELGGVSVPQGRPRSSCGPAPSATSTTGCSTGARRRSSGSTSTTTAAPTSAVTVDDDPAQELFRETGRYLFFKSGEVEVVRRRPG